MPRPQLLLCYHKVGPAAEEGRWLNIEPRRLRSHVAYFSRRNWAFRTAAQAPQRETGTVGFQFDDAYASALRNVPPIFAEFNGSATFWVVPTLAGGSSVWDGERAAPLADWQALTTARAAGHEIGNHTLSHPRLSTLDRAAQRREIDEARRLLEERGFITHSLCFPYGAYDDLTLETMGELGLRAGFSLAKRPARSTDPVLALPRIVVAYSDTVAGMLYKTYIRPRLP